MHKTGGQPEISERSSTGPAGIPHLSKFPPPLSYARATPGKGTWMASRPLTTPARLRLASPPAEANPPPGHLSPAMCAWWRSVLESHDLEEHHLHLLESAASAWDRMVQARLALDEHGLIFEDRNGDPKARPEVAIERDARTAFARLVRELDLDAAPPPQPRGRPPGLRSNRG